ncbi:MAG: hypothetical protein ACK559_23980, partial [bacterium]
QGLVEGAVHGLGVGRGADAGALLRPAVGELPDAEVCLDGGLGERGELGQVERAGPGGDAVQREGAAAV